MTEGKKNGCPSLPMASEEDVGILCFTNSVPCFQGILKQRYWVTEMHVDGLRFDLASIMTCASSLWKILTVLCIAELGLSFPSLRCISRTCMSRSWSTVRRLGCASVSLEFRPEYGRGHYFLQVARLQEQIQAERDLRAALEIGLTTSQLASPQNLEPKTRADLEEIAGVEAEVARLKQKVADLHLQLNQQRHHGENSSDRTHRVKTLQSSTCWPQGYFGPRFFLDFS